MPWWSRSTGRGGIGGLVLLPNGWRGMRPVPHHGALNMTTSLGPWWRCWFVRLYENSVEFLISSVDGQIFFDTPLRQVCIWDH